MCVRAYVLALAFRHMARTCSQPRTTRSDKALQVLQASWQVLGFVRDLARSADGRVIVPLDGSLHASTARSREKELAKRPFCQSHSASRSSATSGLYFAPRFHVSFGASVREAALSTTTVLFLNCMDAATTGACHERVAQALISAPLASQPGARDFRCSGDSCAWAVGPAA